jgi:predicted phage terminase large subunit-like protein
MSALQFVKESDYAALILRKSYADLKQPGALIPRSIAWLAGTAARWSAQDHMWTFPSGAVLKFGYLDTEQDRFQFQSSEFQFCVARGTMILMADGTTKAIETVKLGDHVRTIDGDRAVTRLHCFGIKPVVKITTQFGSATVSVMHRILSPYGWVSPFGLQSMQCHSCGNTFALSGTLTAESLPQRELKLSDRPREPATFQQMQDQNSIRGFASSSASNQSDSAKCYDCNPANEQLQGWIAPLMLYAPELQSPETVHGGETPPHEYCHVPIWTEGEQGLRLGYQWSEHCHDARLHERKGADQLSIPSRGDVVPSFPYDWPDDQDNILRHSQSWKSKLCHPYTMEPFSKASLAALVCSDTQMVRAGEEEVFDLTVEGSSHYITKNRIISSNCGFDELTQFTQADYRFLFSRLRRSSGGKIPLRMRSASNPGGKGHDWVKRRFLTEGVTHGRIYVPARLSDNPHIDQEAYRRSLSELDPVTRKQIENGDWSARAPGSQFQREWFKVVEGCPSDIKRWCRFWDLAATEPKPGHEPDWTAGALVGLKDGQWWIKDIRRFRGTPKRNEDVIKQTAQIDPASVITKMEQEGGAAGKSLVSHYARNVLVGVNFSGAHPNKDKVTRAAVVSSAAENGNVFLVNGPWVGDFLDEAEAFPDGSFDDQIDAVSGGFATLKTGQIVMVA